VFFFQAEDGIRYWSVTGVQTCALPIWAEVLLDAHHARDRALAGEAGAAEEGEAGDGRRRLRLDLKLVGAGTDPLAPEAGAAHAYTKAPAGRHHKRSDRRQRPASEVLGALAEQKPAARRIDDLERETV